VKLVLFYDSAYFDSEMRDLLAAAEDDDLAKELGNLLDLSEGVDIVWYAASSFYKWKMADNLAPDLSWPAWVDLGLTRCKEMEEESVLANQLAPPQSGV